MGDAENKIDATAILRGIEVDNKHAQDAFAPNATLLYAIWGFAWVVGIFAVYLSFVPAEKPIVPFVIGAAIAAAVLVAAIMLSAVHTARRSKGSRGPSMIQGAIFGNAHAVGFVLMGLLGWRLSSAGVPLLVMLSYWLVVPCLIVGLLGAVGAGMWNDRSQFVFAVWTLVVGLASIAVVPPNNLLVGVVGGIGYLALAIIQAVRPALLSGPIARGADG